MPRAFAFFCAVSLLCAPALRAQNATNDDSIRKLRVENFVLPEFPETLRLMGTTSGIVTAAIGRDAEGRVNDVLVLDSTHARFTQAVTEAVKQWKFTRPANPGPPDKEVVPIVRFFFGARGVTYVTATAGTLGGTKDPAVGPHTPVTLPRFQDLDSIPKPLNQPVPRLTGTRAGELAGGTATVKYFVDETGKVRVPIVVECSAPELGRAALAAVEQWTYEPPRLAGRPTIAIETGQITFGKSKD